MRWVQMAFAAAALPLGCYGASTSDDGACVAGMQISCGCDDGDTGTQICGPDGSYGECACEPEAGGSGGKGGTTSGGKGGSTTDLRGGTTNGGNTSGGTTAGGSSGSTSGGSSGSTSGGSGGVIGACNPVAGPVMGDGIDLVIDSLDDTDSMFLTAGLGTGAWDFAKDTSPGTIAPANAASLQPVVGGQSGSALHVQGIGLTGWGAALAAFLNGAASSFDASAYSGVSFYIKGTTAVQEGTNVVMVTARMPDVLPGAGSCCSDNVPGLECYSSHRTVIFITSEWALVELPWSSFVGPAWGLGSTLAFNPNRIRDITFSFNHDSQFTDNGASFDVWIDSLAFMP